MNLWIKICGNTSVEDALLAAEAGADAVGFVFAPSPRQVTTEQVASIACRLPDSVEKIGVFVDATFQEIADTVRSSGLTGAQLHFDARVDLAKRLREEFGGSLRILRVLHYEDRDAANRYPDDSADAVLIDSRTAQSVGGTGLTYDWNAAANSLLHNPHLNQRLVVAGGLTPDNVSQAISVLQPWGVDVVSGVELSPGRKDTLKVKHFVVNARVAAATLATSPTFNRQ